jgi:hypothetical protein
MGVDAGHATAAIQGVEMLTNRALKCCEFEACFRVNFATTPVRRSGSEPVSGTTNIWSNPRVRGICQGDVFMGFLDSIVGRSFRDEKAGRVVVFAGDRRNRGYLVKSEAEELKIRAFLKMFHLAQVFILLLGMLLTNAWSTFVINLREFGRPAEHLLRSESIFLGIYAVVVLLPYFLLWRSYKKALPSFVSVQDEVVVSARSPGRRPWTVAALIAFGALLLLGVIVYLVFRAD